MPLKLERPAGLMRAAMEWFSDAMVRGDRGESNAALSYMGDLLTAVAADRRAAVDAVRGGNARERTLAIKHLELLLAG